MTAPTMRVLVILSSETAGSGDGERPAFDFDSGSEQAALDVAQALCARLNSSLTVLSLGATEAHLHGLRAALARGCARAVALTWNEESSEDSGEPSQARAERPPHELDYLGVAEVLRAAIVHLGTRVVVCPDDAFAQSPNRVVGPAVAELMGAAHMTGVIDVRPRSHNGNLGLWVEQRDGRARCRFFVEAPVVLTFDGRGLVRDKRPAALSADADAAKEIEFLATADLGIDHELLERGKLVTEAADEPTTTMVESAEELLARLSKGRLLL